MLIKTKNQEYVLNFCSNIFSGESFEEIFDSFKEVIPKIKMRLESQKEFYFGAHFSYSVTKELSESSEKMSSLIFWMKENNILIQSLNGFPYQDFHKKGLKKTVYWPDWSSLKRLDYTKKLAIILSDLPNHSAFSSISTVPIGYKSIRKDKKKMNLALENLAEIILFFKKIFEEKKVLISLALEPEPECFLSTSDDVVNFFCHSIFIEKFYKKISDSKIKAKEIIKRHLGICYDTCHMAVEFEDPEESMKKIVDNEIEIFKIQLSSGLKISGSAREVIEYLEKFNDGIYLHQSVLKKDNGEMIHFLDLENIKEISPETEGEFRVHFHVPLFLNKFERASGTDDFTKEIIKIYKKNKMTSHLETETYTFDVLPPEFKLQKIEECLAKELEWCKRQF